MHAAHSLKVLYIETKEISSILTKSKYSFPKYHLFLKASLFIPFQNFYQFCFCLWQEHLCLMGLWTEDNLSN